MAICQNARTQDFIQSFENFYQRTWADRDLFLARSNLLSELLYEKSSWHFVEDCGAKVNKYS